MLRTHRARIHRRLTPCIALSGMLALLASSPSPASAEGVVIAKFKGNARLAKSTRLEVIRALNKRYELVPVKQLQRARKSLGVRGSDTESWAQLAAEIGAAGIVTGDIERKGRRYRITIAVRTGKDGQLVDSTTITLRRTRITRREKRQIKQKTLQLMDLFDSRIAELEAEAEAEAEAEDLRDQDGGDASSAKGDAGVSKASGGGPSFSGSAHAGFAFIGRSLSFQVGDDIAAAQQPNEYDGPPAFGFRVAGEVFALGAFSEAARPVAISFVYDRSLFLSTAFGNEEFPTQQTRFGLGAHYTYSLAGMLDPFGGSAASPSVRGGLGYQRASFTIDSGDVETGLPDVAYDALTLSVGARVPAMEKLIVHADFAVLVGLSSGDINEMANYGDGGATGIEFDIGGSYDVLELIHVQAGFRMLRMGLGFDGNGALAELNDDGVADVSGASDLYLGIYVTGGYRF